MTPVNVSTATRAEIEAYRQHLVKTFAVTSNILEARSALLKLLRFEDEVDKERMTNSGTGALDELRGRVRARRDIAEQLFPALKQKKSGEDVKIVQDGAY